MMHPSQLLLLDLPCPVEDPDSNEWYTPRSIIEAARYAMGSIDLDPASCEEAQQIVQAGRYFTKAEDGLVQPWAGNVWLNPPYGRGLIEEWVEKAIYEMEFMRTNQIIMLVNNCTETEWFQSLLDEAHAVCFPCGRIEFWGPNRRFGSGWNGQAIFWLARHFEGDTWRRFLGSMPGTVICL